MINENEIDSDRDSNELSFEVKMSKRLKFPVYIVKSSWSLVNIRDFLAVQFGASLEDIYHIKIDRKQGQETNRTIIMMNPKIYDDAISQKYRNKVAGIDFMITEYVLREYNYPKEGYSNNLYIPLRDDINVTDANESLCEFFENCVKAGLISSTDYRIDIPLKSRETGQHAGAAYIVFGHKIDIETIAMIRVLLNDTHIYHESETGELERILINCYWARQVKGKKGKHNQKKTSNKQVTVIRRNK
jgi:hypothetical protein